jgi:hypothetical protein
MDDAQRIGRWLHQFSPDTVALKSQFVRLFPFTILHLLTLPIGEKRQTSYCFGGQSQQRKEFSF